MKKIITFMLAVMLVMSLAVPAYAHDGSTGIGFWGSWWTGWFDFFPSVPEDPTVPETALDATAVTEARFYHSGSVASLRNRLQIEWDAVENAESYEIEVTKADGSVMSYTSASASLMIKNSQCPKVYLEASGTWASASVRVRAIAGDAVGPWSDAVKIGCDQLH